MSPFAARITVFERSALARGLAASPERVEKWLELQAIDERILQVVAAARAREDIQPEFDSQQCEAGDVILREGHCTEQIFELLDGHAVVSAGGVLVGEVHAGEIFGEIGFLTAEPCTATVIADEVCTVSGRLRALDPISASHDDGPRDDIGPPSEQFDQEARRGRLKLA